MVESPVLTQVKARFEGLDVYDVEPAVLPDVLGERPVIVFGKWRGEARGRLVVEGRGAEGPYRQALKIDPEARRDAAALRSLWARHRIASLSDQEALEGGDALRQRITDLGLRYGLLTQYTSFIAIDRVVRNPAPQSAAGVDQPQPLPQGVAESALGQDLGAEVPSTPEPETLGAIAVVLSMLAMLRRRARARKIDLRTDRAKQFCTSSTDQKKRHHHDPQPPLPPATPASSKPASASTALPALAWLALQAAALAPTWTWMARRMLDRSDDPLGLLAIAALALLVFTLRHGLRAAPRLGWLALAALATLAATLGRTGIGPLPPLPPLAAALLAMAALACALLAFLPSEVAATPVAGLAVLALPLLSSLQFYAGYPLRVDHGRGQPLAAGAGLRGRARRQQPLDRWPAGDRRRALLGRADGLARLLHGLRGRALGAARRPRASWPGCRRSACWCWPATSCATACWWPWRRPARRRALAARRLRPGLAGGGLRRHRLGHEPFPHGDRHGHRRCLTAASPTASCTASLHKALFARRHAALPGLVGQRGAASAPPAACRGGLPRMAERMGRRAAAPAGPERGRTAASPSASRAPSRA